MDFLIETRYCIPLLEAHFFWNQLRGSLLGSQSKLITSKGKQRRFKNRIKLMIFFQSSTSNELGGQLVYRSTNASLKVATQSCDKLKPKETESFYASHHSSTSTKP